MHQAQRQTIEQVAIEAFDLLTQGVKCLPHPEFEHSGEKQNCCPKCQLIGKLEPCKFGFFCCENGHQWAPTQGHCLEDEEFSQNRQREWAYVPLHQREGQRWIQLQAIAQLAESVLAVCKKKKDHEPKKKRKPQQNQKKRNPQKHQVKKSKTQTQ